jgi:hypothetical protein
VTLSWVGDRARCATRRTHRLVTRIADGFANPGAVIALAMLTLVMLTLGVNVAPRGVN